MHTILISIIIYIIQLMDNCEDFGDKSWKNKNAIRSGLDPLICPKGRYDFLKSSPVPKGDSELPNVIFQNHHLFYQEALSNQFITSNAKLTVVTLQSLNLFIRCFPRKLFDEILCTKSFVDLKLYGYMYIHACVVCVTMISGSSKNLASYIAYYVFICT